MISPDSYRDTGRTRVRRNESLIVAVNVRFIKNHIDTTLHYYFHCSLLVAMDKNKNKNYQLKSNSKQIKL